MAEPTPLHPAATDTPPGGDASSASSESSDGFKGGPPDAAKLLDIARASADQEFQIAERLAAKARQGFGLAAAYFAICQTVSFGGFEASRINTDERERVIYLAVGAAGTLFIAAIAAMRADGLFESGDLPLDKMPSELDAAYDGDDGVLQRLTEFFLGIALSRRKSNKRRRNSYKVARALVFVSMGATTTQLVVALVARI